MSNSNLTQRDYYYYHYAYARSIITCARRVQLRRRTNSFCKRIKRQNIVVDDIIMRCVPVYIILV